jgi:hypothetical protein
MKQGLVILAAGLMVISALPYVRDIRQTKTRPNLVSWFTWMLLSTITMLASVSAGEYVAAVFAGSVVAETLLIVCFGLRYGYVNFGPLEIICQIGALAGIILWQIFNSPAVGVVAMVIIDMIGALPTLKHAWQRPHEETWSTYALAAAAGGCAVLALQDYNWVSLPYALYVCLIDLIIFVTIHVRRKFA